MEMGMKLFVMKNGRKEGNDDFYLLAMAYP